MRTHFRSVLVKIAGSEMPFVDQPHLDMFSDLILIIDERYHFHVHRAFMCTRTEYFSVVVKNHFNEMLLNSTHVTPTMCLKHIRKELFLPLLYYIYCNECEVNSSSQSSTARRFVLLTLDPQRLCR